MIYGNTFLLLNFVRKEGRDDEIVSSSFKYEEKDITIQEILLVAGYLQLGSQLDSARGEYPPLSATEKDSGQVC